MSQVPCTDLDSGMEDRPGVTEVGICVSNIYSAGNATRNYMDLNRGGKGVAATA